ncbi:MAG TPA: hypothetical protein PLT66_02625 [Bacillota bacterium]|nr:hypothetical protein [Bacillota bacterium]
MKKKRAIEFAIICAVALVTALFIECVILHIPDFITASKLPEQQTLTIGNAYLSGGARFDANGNIFISSNADCAITFHGITGGFSSVYLAATGEEGYKTITITVRDPESDYEVQLTENFSPSSRESMYFETPSGATTLILEIKECEGMTIGAVIINSPPPYEFFLLRFALIWGVLILIGAAVRFKLYRIVFDPTVRTHNGALALTALILCAAATFISTFYSALTVEYPLTDDSLAYGNYVVQTDAFIKGQVELDIEVPKKLFDCENPYSPSDRRAHGVSSANIWDKAFYNGKLYSYFGVAPVVLVYMPVYWLTGRMATDMMPCFIFALISIIFITLLMRELTIRYLKNVRLLLLCCGIATVCCGGLVFAMEASANFYTVAVMGGMAFLPAYLYFALRGARAASTLHRCLLFAASGVCFALIVGCRPNAALYGIVVFPTLFSVLGEKQTKLSAKLSYVASFAVPILLGLGALMWYNSIRFSGPFDFGNNYQITVSDVSENTIRFVLLPTALFHYFLQPPDITRFPFVSLSRIKLPSYPVDYIYVGENLGSFSFLNNLWLLPGVAGGMRKEKLEKNLFVILTLMTAVLLAFLDTCLAGVHIRYTTDMMMMVSIAAVILMLTVTSKRRFGIIHALAYGTMLASILLGFMLTIDNEVDLIMHNSADLLLELMRMMLVK